jgi:hypothetical protein
MRIVARALNATAGVVGLVGSALAADMTGAEIAAFISGKTSFQETTPDSLTGKAGQGVIYWGADGTALYKTPMGVRGTASGKSKATRCAPTGRRNRTLHARAMTRLVTRS